MSDKPPARLSDRPLRSRSYSTVSSFESQKTLTNLGIDRTKANQGSTSNYHGINIQQPPPAQKFVRWGIVWHAPALIAMYAAGGLALAVGHHFYFASLHGTLAGSSARQQWATGFGTAASFLIVALLRAASSAAYNQYVWVLVRRNSYRLETLDKLFALTNDPSGFFGMEMFKCAKIAMAVALISWITPLAGITPPASLSVVSGLIMETRPTWMATPNWNSDAFYDLQPDFSLPSAKVVSIATQSALGMEVIPLTPPAANSSFTIQFYGPSIQCSPANSTQKLIMNHYAAALARNFGRVQTAEPIVTQKTLKQRFDGNGSQVNSTVKPPDISRYSMLVLSAFAPYAGPQGWLHGLAEPGSIDQFNNWDADLPWEMDEMGWDVNNYLYDDVVQSLFLQTSTGGQVCLMGNSSYLVSFDYINGVQASLNYTTSGFVPTVVMRSGGGGSGGATQNRILDGPYNRTYHTGFELSYMAVWEAFTSMVSGNISFGYFGLTSDERPGMEYNLTLRDISSRVLLTGLSACDEVVHNYWDSVPLTLKDPEKSPEAFFKASLPPTSNFSNHFMEQPAWRCRNRTLPRAVEDLLGNITISMLSSSNLTSLNAALVDVTYQTTRNIYRYDNRNLIISYATAVVLTIFGVGIGVFAFLDNGVAHSMAFSAMLATTRNSELNDLSVGHSLGALPLDEDVGRVRLRFGELSAKGQHDHGNGAAVGRVGFGFEGDVGEIYKGDRYI